MQSYILERKKKETTKYKTNGRKTGVGFPVRNKQSEEQNEHHSHGHHRQNNYNTINQINIYKPPIILT